MLKNLFFIALFAAAAVYAAEAQALATLDTSNEEAYSQSLIKMYDSLPEEERTEFEAFLFCAVFDGKILPLSSKLNNLNNMETLYEVIKKLEAEEKIAINGQDAKSIVKQGRLMLNRYLKERIAASTDMKEKQRLESQLAIINRQPLSRKDLDAYNRMRR